MFALIASAIGQMRRDRLWWEPSISSSSTIRPASSKP